jgi:hypothetical protein
MDAELLQRVLNLAERTGDRMIIVNPQSGEAHAVLPLDAYEDLVEGGASLHDLGDWAGDNEGDRFDIDDFIVEPEVKTETKKTPSSPEPITDRELEKLVQHDLDIIKMAEQGQKEVEAATPLDVLEDEANEEQYYLEPLK